jgi:hypothetical protein
LGNQRNSLIVLFIIFMGIAAIAGLTWMNYNYAEKFPAGNDFVTRWNGAKNWVVEGNSPYDPKVVDSTQRLIYGRLANPAKGESRALFDYPLYSMLFFGPFGAIDPISARALWMTLSEIALVAVGLISLKLSGWKVPAWGLILVCAFSLLWYCGARGVILGEFAPINALIILTAIYLVQRKRDMDAGLLFALSMTQPYLNLLVVVFALIWGVSSGRGKLAIGIVGGWLFLIVLSLVFMPGWPAQWFWQLLNLADYSGKTGSVISIIASALPGITKPLNWVLYSVTGVYLVLEWVVAWGRDDRWFTWTALVTLVITFFVAPQSSIPDYVVLIPVYFFLFRSWKERWGNGGQQIAWASVLFTLVGFWVLSLIKAHNGEESVIYALIVPFASLLALWWGRWWGLQRARLYFDEYSA